METQMKSKLLAGATALAIVTAALLASNAPASAQWLGWGGPWSGYSYGYGYGYPAYGYYQGYNSYYPGYAGYEYSPGYAYAGYGNAYAYEPYANERPATIDVPTTRRALARDEGMCARRYRSYDPATLTFLGRDGTRHHCP
jgi:BA14K-like protein